MGQGRPKGKKGKKGPDQTNFSQVAATEWCGTERFQYAAHRNAARRWVSEYEKNTAVYSFFIFHFLSGKLANFRGHNSEIIYPKSGDV